MDFRKPARPSDFCKCCIIFARRERGRKAKFSDSLNACQGIELSFTEISWMLLSGHFECHVILTGCLVRMSIGPCIKAWSSSVASRIAWRYAITSLFSKSPAGLFGSKDGLGSPCFARCVSNCLVFVAMISASSPMRLVAMIVMGDGPNENFNICYIY